MAEPATNNHSSILDPTRAAFAQNQRIEELGRTHFIGIGGAGMSVLAEMLAEQGIEVSGSDREANTKTERLQQLGIPVAIGQSADNIVGVKTVVYSSAIQPNNPEIVAAHEAGLRIVHRSDILALLMQSKQSVAVAGAHGKTTTSSLLAHMVSKAGTGDMADPSYAIGGSIQGEHGSVKDGGHLGKGRVLVAEADESDGSFLKYRPCLAIITNAEPDHLDHYGTVEHYHEAFVTYAQHAQQHSIICFDDEGAREVFAALDKSVAQQCVLYSTQDAESFSDLRGAQYVRIERETESANSGAEEYTLDIPAEVLGTLHAQRIHVALAIPGIHNARNATAAIIAAILLGLDATKAVEAAASFLGAQRRFQVIGSEKGVTVVDDYAHHPTEIAALLEAAHRRYPTSTIRVLFQPHLFSRTQFFAQEFAEALSKADDVIVTGIYPARELQSDFPHVHASTIVEAAQSLQHEPNKEWICAVDNMELAAQMLVMRSHTSDVLFTVGAGDITQMGEVLLHALVAHRGACE